MPAVFKSLAFLVAKNGCPLLLALSPHLRLGVLGFDLFSLGF